MSQAILLNGVLATDSQMLNRIRERDDYISYGKKLFISPDNRAAIGVVGAGVLLRNTNRLGRI